MGTIGCNEFLNCLDAWMEGQHSAGARAHLLGCPSCRNVAEDLDMIQTAARTRATDEPEPPARIWTSLRAQLEQEGLIRDGRPEVLPATQQHWLGGIFAALPRPALAGAYLAALIAVAFGLSGPMHRQLNDYRWTQGTQISTTPLSAQLDTVEQGAISSLADANPLVAASLHENLAIVDNYIALCEKSVREEPENEVARDYLYGAYEQKADLLAQISERGDYGR